MAKIIRKIDLAEHVRKDYEPTQPCPVCNFKYGAHSCITVLSKKLAKSEAENVRLRRDCLRLAKNVATLTQKPKYKHYNGNDYTMICERAAIHSEPKKSYTVYMNSNGAYWIRKQEEFHEEVKPGILRFTEMEVEDAKL